MGKATKRKREPRAPAASKLLGPTVQAEAHGNYVRHGMGYRRVPVIDTMLERDQITRDEHRRLSHYRDQALLSERSPTRSCLDNSVGGGTGFGLPAAIVSAMLTCARIERDLGSLADIVKAVAVENQSLTQWCIAKHGGRERYGKGGKFVAMVPVNENDNMNIATIELRMGARRIVA